jgi:hypothetical protein
MNQDLNWEVLLAAFERKGKPIPVELLQTCYEISKEHQFDEDRGPILRKLRSAVEDYVTAWLDGKGESDAAS